MRTRAPTPPHLLLRAAQRALAGLRSHRVAAVALLAVMGPGLLAGLSDDDPAGITTYSIIGADHGYRLLIAVSVVALGVLTAVG